MVTWTLVVGYLIAALMWAVQLFVIRAGDAAGGGDNWPKMAPQFRNTMRVVVLVGLVVWAVVSALAIFDAVIRESPGFLVGYRSLIDPSQGPVLLLLIAFFTGSLRLFLERTLDGGPDKIGEFILDLWHSVFNPSRYREKIKTLSLAAAPGAGKNDPWVTWFAMTLVVGIVMTLAGDRIQQFLVDSGGPGSEEGSAEAIVDLSTAEGDEVEVVRGEGSVAVLVGSAIADENGTGDSGGTENATAAGDAIQGGVEAVAAESGSEENLREGAGEGLPVEREAERGKSIEEDPEDPVSAPLTAAARAWLAVLAIVANTIIYLGCISWVYVGIFSRMVNVFHFSARFARGFIGNLLETAIPRQCVLIGPVQTGKTVFASGSLNCEQSNRVRLFPKRVKNTDVTFIDTPGENLGDHILIASRYRSDTLILVLGAHLLDLNKALGGQEKPCLWTIDKCANLIRHVSRDIQDEEVLYENRHYLQALALATTLDDTREEGHAERRSDVFRARSFLLFLNDFNLTREDQQTLKAIMESGGPTRLARELGKRFGVNEVRCRARSGQAVSEDSRELVIDLADSACKVERNQPGGAPGAGFDGASREPA